MEKLEKRLQFVITIALFFTVILDAIFKLAPNNFNSNQIVLLWGASVAALLVDYIVLELAENKLKPWVYKYTNRLLLADVAMFVVLLVVNAAVSVGTAPLFYKLPYIVSLYGVLLIPMVILAIFISDILHTEFFPTCATKKFKNGTGEIRVN